LKPLKNLFAACACTLLLPFSPIASAEERLVNVVFCDSPGSISRQEVISEISARFPATFVDCGSAVPTQSQIFVALSYSDAIDILSNDHLASSPIVISNVYRNSVSDVLAANEKGDIYTFFNDPDPRAQLLLSKAIFPDLPRLLLIYSYATHSIAVEYQQTASLLGLELHLAAVKDEKGVLKTIQDYRDVDAIILIPDKHLYNKMTLPNIIRSSYQSNIPLIGFSPGLVQSGILGTTYPSIQARIDFVDTIVDHYVQNHDKSNTPLDGHSHGLSINRRVARSLGMEIAEDGVLIGSIQEREE
jgi:ABC-type uncharacterized transport system substrate-binding protein